MELKYNTRTLFTIIIYLSKQKTHTHSELFYLVTTPDNNDAHRLKRVPLTTPTNTDTGLGGAD